MMARRNWSSGENHKYKLMGGLHFVCVSMLDCIYTYISLGVSVLAVHLNGKQYWRRRKKQDDHVNTIARILEITMQSSLVAFLNIKYPEYLSSRMLATNMYMALRTFYVHLETRQTTWDNPAELIMCHLALEVQQTVFQILDRRRIGEFPEGESNPTARNDFCLINVTITSNNRVLVITGVRLL